MFECFVCKRIAGNTHSKTILNCAHCNIALMKQAHFLSAQSKW